MKVIVDTNVAVVANGGFEKASEGCKQICVDRLQQVSKGEVRLVLDDKRRIIEEHRGNLSPYGQPGVGDAFLKWVETNWTNPERCDLVSTTSVEGLENEYEEFPDEPALAAFDRDDRKFIAVALAHPEKPPILQATDTQWWDFRDALNRNGVTVEFICEDDIQRLREES